MLVLRRDGDGWRLLWDGYTMATFEQSEEARSWLRQRGYAYHHEEDGEEVWSRFTVSESVRQNGRV